MSADRQSGYKTWTKGEGGEITDRERIVSQNTSEGRARWGLGHKAYLEEVRGYLLSLGVPLPTRYAELGVGPDATLVANTLDVFGDSLEDGGLVVFELDAERLQGAENTLRERFSDRPDLLQKLKFVAGDAGQTLPTEGSFDVVHAQLLYQHLLPQERHAILQASADSLTEDGLMIVSDLAFDDWTARSTSRRLSPRRRHSEEMAERSRDTIQRLRYTGYRALGKKDFADSAEVEAMIIEETAPEGRAPVLEIIPELRREWRVSDIKPGEDEVGFMAQIAPRLTNGDEDLALRAANYVKALLRGGFGVAFDYPTMVRTAARRRTTA